MRTIMQPAALGGFAAALSILSMLSMSGCSSGATTEAIGSTESELTASATATTSGCKGTAPLCFGNNIHLCCGNDPSGSAVCRAGEWKCGTAPAPGCDGTSCLLRDAGQDSGGCSGKRPLCFGDDIYMCCGNDPSGFAVCRAGEWMCGSAPAPGCDGTSCILP
jgi:hypothetical protein